MITPATALITVLLVILIFVLPRRYMLVPFVLTACFVPADQHASVFGLHFYVSRILIFSGLLRILIRDEMRLVRWNRLDRLILAWALVGAIIYVLRRMEFQAIIYKSGVLVDILGLYWIVRQTTQSWEDIKQVVATFAVSIIILMPFVAMEWSTGVNPFLFLGAVGTGFREGEFRCMASFRHPIVAGSFMACLVPVFISAALTEKNKVRYWMAVAAAVFIAFASNSSTPIGGLAAILLLLAAYRYRQHGRQMAIIFFGSLAMLHLVMKAPVWSLLFRITIIPGSTGWHRYILIDAAVRHFTEWMFLGTDSTAAWGPHLFDVTNHFILEGVRGGALTLALFIAVLIVAVRAAGGFSQRPTSRDRQWLSWALCASILGHCIMFIGLGYFGQIEIILYMTLAFAGFIYEQNMQPNPTREIRRLDTVYSQAAAGGYPGVVR